MDQEPQPPLRRQMSEHRQIADRVRQAIASGQYAPGSLLPPETTLAEIYGTGRQTINRAMMLLRDEGVVRVERGRGTFVTSVPVIRRNAVGRYSRAARERSGSRGAFDGEIRALGMAPRTETTISRVVPPPEVGATLGAAEGEQVVRRMRHMFADDFPVQLAPSYIPADLADGTALAEVDSGPGGIISRFAELGHEQVRISESVSVRRATDEEQEFLRLEPDQPVVQIFHTGWDADGRAVEVCIHSIPAYRWVLAYEWPIT